MKSKKYLTKTFAILGIISILIIGLFVTFAMAQSADNQGKANYGSDSINFTGTGAGWKVIPVLPSMVGKSLSELTRTGDHGSVCQDAQSNIAAWMFDNSDNPWIVMQNFGGTIPSSLVSVIKFRSDHVWFPLWIRIKDDDCVIGCGVNGCMKGGSEIGRNTLTGDIEDEVTTILSERGNRVITVAGIDYDVTVVFVDANSAKFSINGMSTPDMAIGSIFGLWDGNIIKVRDILYQDFAGGVKRVEFSLIAYRRI